jgi:translation elongation factor EF-Tu-like GTPase
MPFPGLVARHATCMEKAPRDQDPLRAYGEREGYFRVRLRLLTQGEGGRRSGVADGYRFSWNWDETTEEGALVIHDGPLLVEDGEGLEPGQEAVVRIHPIFPEFWIEVRPGTEITMREGSRIVGRAEVLERVEPRT